jgi:CRISPR/Cas system-associated endoribonuclease Cas2
MADLTYKQLQKAVADLQVNTARAAEAIRSRATRIDEEAQDTARVAEMVARMKVDNETVAETKHVARIMRGVSEAAIAYASAGDTTAKAAKATHEQAKTTHSGIQEAVSRSNVTNVYDLNREWLRQD